MAISITTQPRSGTMMNRLQSTEASTAIAIANRYTKRLGRNPSILDTKIIGYPDLHIPQAFNTDTIEGTRDAETVSALRNTSHDPFKIAGLLAVQPGVIDPVDTDFGGNSVLGLANNGEAEYQLLGTEGKYSEEAPRKERKAAIKETLLNAVSSMIFGGALPWQQQDHIEYSEPLTAITSKPISLVMGESSRGKSTLCNRLQESSSETFSITNTNNKRSLRSHPTSDKMVMSLLLNRPSEIKATLKDLTTLDTSEIRHIIIEPAAIIDPANFSDNFKHAVEESRTHNNLRTYPRDLRLMHSLPASLLLRSATNPTYGKVKNILYPVQLNLNQEYRDLFPNFETIKGTVESLTKIDKDCRAIDRQNILLTLLEVIGSVIPNDLKAVVAMAAITGTQVDLIPVPPSPTLSAERTYDYKQAINSSPTQISDLILLASLSESGIIPGFKKKINSREYTRLNKNCVLNSIRPEYTGKYKSLKELSGNLSSPYFYGSPTARVFSDLLIGYINLQVVLDGMDKRRRKLF